MRWTGSPPLALGAKYVNDVADESEPARAIYGEAKHERLVALKRIWGPGQHVSPQPERAALFDSPALTWSNALVV